MKRAVLLLSLLVWLFLPMPVFATDGTASWWHGNVAATHDCTWPWTDCQPIAVTSHLTGLRIVITPAMWCQCYVGTSRERLVDLTRSQVRALGLDAADGLFDVTVEHVSATSGLPDTAMVTP